MDPIKLGLGALSLGGGIAALFKGGKKAEVPTFDDPNKDAFTIPSGVDDYWQNEMRGQESRLGGITNDPNIARARGAGSGARQGLMNIAGQLQTGPSISRMEGDRQRGAIHRGISSTLHSLPGGYNPAAARTAQYQQAGLDQSLAGQTAQNVAAERVARQQAAAGIMGGVRQGDLTQQGLEQQLEQSRQQWGAMQESLRQKYLGLGLNDKQAQAQAQMDYEKLLMQKNMQQQMLQFQANAGNQDFWQRLSTGLMGSGMSFMGGAGSGPSAPAGAGAASSGGDPWSGIGDWFGSDRRIKEDVAPADEDVQAFLQAIGGAGSFSDEVPPPQPSVPGFASHAQDTADAARLAGGQRVLQRLNVPQPGLQQEQAFAQMAAAGQGQPVPQFPGQSRLHPPQQPSPYLPQHELQVAGLPLPPQPPQQSGPQLMAQAIPQGPLMTSDVNAKEGVQPGQDAVEQFLDRLSPWSYNYKDPGSPGQTPGRHVGVMAQELEQTPAGAQLITQAPDGTKMVDYSKAGPVMMASLAHLNKRLEAIEGGRPGAADQQQLQGMMPGADEEAMERANFAAGNALSAPAGPLNAGMVGGFFGGPPVAQQPGPEYWSPGALQQRPDIAPLGALGPQSPGPPPMGLGPMARRGY